MERTVEELKAILRAKIQALIEQKVDENSIFAYLKTPVSKDGVTLVEQQEKVNGLESFAREVKNHRPRNAGQDRKGNTIWERDVQFQLVCHATLLQDAEALLAKENLELTGDRTMGAKTGRYLVRASAPKLGVSEL